MTVMERSSFCVTNIQVVSYTPWAIKKGATFIFTILWEMWTDFNNSFTFGFVDKLRST